MKSEFRSILLTQKSLLLKQQRVLMAQQREIMSQQRDFMDQQTDFAVPQTDLMDQEADILTHLQDIEAELAQVNTLIKDEDGRSSIAAFKIVPKTRVRGVLALAKKAVEQFSESFDKKQLLSKMEEIDQELAHKKVTDANIRHTLKLLRQSGVIRLESAATPRSRARYRAA